jgi:hypothetical protein
VCAGGRWLILVKVRSACLEVKILRPIKRVVIRKENQHMHVCTCVYRVLLLAYVRTYGSPSARLPPRLRWTATWLPRRVIRTYVQRVGVVGVWLVGPAGRRVA